MEEKLATPNYKKKLQSTNGPKKILAKGKSIYRSYKLACIAVCAYALPPAIWDLFTI